MNIGVFLQNLQPTSPASARFQSSILEGLSALNAKQFHFVVLSERIPPECSDSAHVSYIALERPSRAGGAARQCKLLIGGAARRTLRILGASSSKYYRRLSRWLEYEPPYYRQLKELKIRLIWNLGVDVLPSFLPFTMVIWDSNHRIHSMFPEYSFAGPAFDWHDRNAGLLARASYVIVGTEQGKQEVVEMFGVHRTKVRVVPFPTPTMPDPEPGENGHVGGDYIFYPARFWPHKNHIVLILALKVLRERWGITPRCVFSGLDDGNLDYVLRTAEALGVREQIEYRGNVSLHELTGLYLGAKAMIYCSAVGPDNFPPLEAMSVGCPVIAAEVPGAREQYGDAALFFDRTSEDQLATRIKCLLEDDELRKALVLRGSQRAARWRPEDYAKSMFEILDEFALIARTWERGDFGPS